MIIPEKIARLPVVWQLRKLAVYVISVTVALIKFRRISIIYFSVIHFPVWWKYKQRDNYPLKNDYPWFSFRAEAFLRKILHPDMTVFEYGSGSSTLYFARRVARVVSVEHNAEWFAHLREAMDHTGIINTDYRLFEAEMHDRAGVPEYGSRNPVYAGMSFESYVTYIDRFPDEYFDLILVDGRSRTACIAHAGRRLKYGGYLVVDNSERAYYFDGNDFLRDKRAWKACHLTGPAPYSFGFSQTSFFQKIERPAQP